MGAQDTHNLLTFIGRREELEELKRLLAQGQRLVTVVAPGGYGKSRLVSELLRMVAGEEGTECYEVLMAPVGDERRIPWIAAEAMGLRLSDSEAPEQQLADFLTGRKAVIHFDNFEHLLGGAPLLSDLLRAVPGVQFIVTSREPLRLPEEHLVNLQALPVGGRDGSLLKPQYSAAVRLFADRAARADANFMLTPDNEEQVRELCESLAGVPLAIELAAAWVDEIDLGRLREELWQQLDLRARTDDVPERHRSVRASCEWSYALLNEYQQLAVRCLSAFRGGFDREAAAALLPSVDLDETLAVLRDKSWLDVRNTPAGPRHFLHNEAIREYAYQKLLNSADYEITVAAHCRYCARLLAGGPDYLESLRRLDASREDLYFAVDTALHQDDASLLAPLAERLHDYLLLVGAAKPCADIYAAIREQAVELDAPEIELISDHALGRALMLLGEYAEAKRHARQAREAAQDAGNQHYAALADVTLGQVSMLEGDHKAARYHLVLALDQFRAEGDELAVLRALFQLGRVAEVESDFATAREMMLECLEIERRHGDLYGMALCFNSLGNMAYREGNYAEARQTHQESLKLRRKLGDLRGIAQSLNSLGNVEFAECDYPAAWTLYSQSLQIRQDIGERFGIAACLNNLGNVQYCEGNYAEAQRLHEEGLALKREIGDYIGCSFSLNNLGNIALKLGDYDKACHDLHEALVIAREVGSTECQIAPIALSCSLFAAKEQLNLAGVLAAGVRQQLTDSGLALDPMDGGMLEAGEHAVVGRLPQKELAHHRDTGEKMSLDELVTFTLDKLQELCPS